MQISWRLSNMNGLQYLVCGLLSLSIGLACGSCYSRADAEDAVQTSVKKRSLAMVLPKPAKSVAATTASPLSGGLKTVNLDEPANAALKQESLTGKKEPDWSRVLKGPPKLPQKPTRPDRISDLMKDRILDAAEKAEFISRSSNRHLADLLVWLYRSLKESTVYSPSTAPYLKQSEFAHYSSQIPVID